MTEGQFYVELAKTDVGWSLIVDPFTKLRMIRGRQSRPGCPLSAVCNRLHGTNFSVTQFYEAGTEMGLSRHRSRRIADAADGYGACDKKRRAKLLTACKLTELI